MPSLYPLQVISVELSESIDITLGSVKMIFVVSIVHPWSSSISIVYVPAAKFSNNPFVFIIPPGYKVYVWLPIPSEV